MNQKSLLCIVVLSIMLITANGLKISHKQETETVDPNSADGKFIAWIGTNQTIKKAFDEKKELSKEEADEVKGYFAKNPEMLDNLVYMGDQKFISCKNSLPAQLRAQFDQDFLDKMDFIQIFSSKAQSPLTEAQFQDVQNNLEADEDFDDFFTCYAKTAQLHRREDD